MAETDTISIIHTSDWHLGQHLMTKDRKIEHEKFLDWLIAYLESEPTDALIVSGDIFDSGTPPNYALTLYYNFLKKASQTPLKKIVILGGNHDSVSTLNAPRDLLQMFDIHVVGGISETCAEENVIFLENEEKKIQAIICGVPFLRDRDVRKSAPGESYEEKSSALLEGIKAYYEQIKDRAMEIKKNLPESGKHIPLIATGHLFAAGGQISEGVRDIHVGSLSHVHVSTFPKEFDYIALGHLHHPQKLKNCEHIRYSGSPIPLSFSEAGTPKEILRISFHKEDTHGIAPEITAVSVPEFQKLLLLKGDMETIREKLISLSVPDGETVWVEVQHQSASWVPDLREKIMEMAEDLPVDILAIKNVRPDTVSPLSRSEKKETLHELSPFDVFEKRLVSQPDPIDEEEKKELIQAYGEIIRQVNEEAN